MQYSAQGVVTCEELETVQCTEGGVEVLTFIKPY